MSHMHRAKRALSRALSPTFQPNFSRDLFLASYPRSGNTWLRAILFHASTGREPTNLDELDYGIPDVHFPVPRRALVRGNASPREPFIIKTHNPYIVDHEYCGGAYIVRNPIAVALSYFRYLKSHSRAGTNDFEEFVSAFACGALWPGSWFEHVRSWKYYCAEHPEVATVIKYESLLDLDKEAIVTFGRFFHISNASNVEELFRHYSFPKMKELENRGNRRGEPQGQFIGNTEARDGTTQYATAYSIVQQNAPHWLPLMEDLGYSTAPRHD